MLIKEIIQKDKIEFNIHKNLDSIFDILKKHGSIFIIDNDSKINGIITDGDIRRLLDKKIKINNSNIEKIMTKNPISISENDNISNALQTMRSKSINILSVVNEDKRYLGFITLHHLLNYFSPERIYLEDNLDDNKERHLARYHFATSFLPKDFKVLDCACGSGYGSEILSEKVDSILGIDLSTDAIQYANDNHSRKNITFENGDIKDLHFNDNSFDAVISFETIEHIPKDICLEYLEKISQWITIGGIAILSSPMLRYKNGKPYVTNPYHINEMPKNELFEIFEKIFSDFKLYYFHQKQNVFLPLLDESTGFMIVVARKVK